MLIPRRKLRLEPGRNFFNTYFQMYPMASGFKVLMAFMPFRSKAKKWYKNLITNKPKLTWEELVVEVEVSYPNLDLLDVVSEFIKLKQEGNIEQ